MRRLLQICLVLPIVALYACTTETDRLDAEAKRLCALDGGIKIYETVTLPSEKFNEYGQPLIPIGKDDKNFGFFSTSTQEHIAGQLSQQAGDGAGLKKSTTQIVRTSDKKIMGEERIYRRHGGRLLDGYMQGGGFQCPTSEGWALERKIFLRHGVNEN